MGHLAEATVRDEFLPEEIVKYKPISPTAILSLLFGLAAVVAACTTPDVGWSFAAVPVIGVLLSLRGIRSIRRYDMIGKPAAVIGGVLSTLSLFGGSAYYSYYLKTEVPTGYVRVDYESLQPTAGVGPDGVATHAKAVDGKKIYITGYTYPTSQHSGIKSFVLCRDNSTCCFGGQPKLTDMIEVKFKEPLTMDYTSSARSVGGTFRVAAEKSPGGLGTIMYHLDNVEVLR
jgi:hypothetical protein